MTFSQFREYVLSEELECEISFWLVPDEVDGQIDHTKAEALTCWGTFSGKVFLERIVPRRIGSMSYYDVPIPQ